MDQGVHSRMVFWTKATTGTYQTKMLRNWEEGVSTPLATVMPSQVIRLISTTSRRMVGSSSVRFPSDHVALCTDNYFRPQQTTTFPKCTTTVLEISRGLPVMAMVMISGLQENRLLILHPRDEDLPRPLCICIGASKIPSVLW